jgi:hypothetical protein
MVAKIHADLLHAAIGDERRDGVAEWAQAALGQASSHTDHVRLRHTTVVKAVRELRLELVEEAVADVGGEQDHARVLPGEGEYLICKSVSHRSPSSFLAASTSVALGTR